MNIAQLPPAVPAQSTLTGLNPQPSCVNWLFFGDLSMIPSSNAKSTGRVTTKDVARLGDPPGDPQGLGVAAAS